MTHPKSQYVAAWALACALSCMSYAQPVLVGGTSFQSQDAMIVDIDVTTGTASNPRNTGISVLGGIAFQQATGQLFALTTAPSNAVPNSLVRIDILTGQWNLVGSTGLYLAEGDLAFNPLDGFLYGLQDVTPAVNQRNLFRVNTTTGLGTLVGPLPASADYSAMAFDSLGSLYVIDTGFAVNSTLHRINPSTGAILTSSTMNVDLGSAAGMAFDPTTGTYYVADGGDPAATNILYSLDVTSATLTSIGPIGFGISGLSFVTVPEPTSFGLIAFVLSGFAIRRVSKMLRGSHDIT